MAVRVVSAAAVLVAHAVVAPDAVAQVAAVVAASADDARFASTAPITFATLTTRISPDFADTLASAARLNHDVSSAHALDISAL